MRHYILPIGIRISKIIYAHRTTLVWCNGADVANEQFKPYSLYISKNKRVLSLHYTEKRANDFHAYTLISLFCDILVLYDINSCKYLNAPAFNHAPVRLHAPLMRLVMRSFRIDKTKSAFNLFSSDISVGLFSSSARKSRQASFFFAEARKWPRYNAEMMPELPLNDTKKTREALTALLKSHIKQVVLFCNEKDLVYIMNEVR